MRKIGFILTSRFPLGHRVKEREDKANVIIQSHLGCLDMHGESHLLTEGQKLIKVLDGFSLKSQHKDCF